jgi:hypothetical protein
MNLRYVLPLSEFGHTTHNARMPYPNLHIWRTLSPASNQGFLFHDFYDRQALVLAGMTGRISFPNTPNKRFCIWQV